MCRILSLSYLFSTIVPWHLLDCGNQLCPVPFIPLPHITIGFTNVSLDSRCHLSIPSLYSLRLLRHSGLWQPDAPKFSSFPTPFVIVHWYLLDCGNHLCLVLCISISLSLRMASTMCPGQYISSCVTDQLSLLYLSLVLFPPLHGQLFALRGEVLRLLAVIGSHWVSLCLLLCSVLSLLLADSDGST
jgi:hypothetical protein